MEVRATIQSHPKSSLAFEVLLTEICAHLKHNGLEPHGFELLVLPTTSRLRSCLLRLPIEMEREMQIDEH